MFNKVMLGVFAVLFVVLLYFFKYAAFELLLPLGFLFGGICLLYGFVLAWTQKEGLKKDE